MSKEFALSIDISDFEFSKNALPAISRNQWVKNKWPLIYFLQNQGERIAYVGETVNAFNRINDHLSNQQKSAFKKISIVGSDKFNKSATLTIESQLIQHISAEGSFLLQNGNNGLSHHNYYQRAEYHDLFVEIWSKLLEHKVVRKSIDEIQNSDYFKYSPYKSLNQDQHRSVLEILRNINNENVRHIFVEGSSGTGKTILATYLIKLLTSQYEELNRESIDEEGYLELELMAEFKKKYSKPSIGLVVAMQSLRKTLKKVFAEIPGLDKSMVIGPSDTFKEHYDILIVDEAHRLRQRKNISFMGKFTENNTKLGLGNEGTELDWILSNSTYQVLFYDAAQSVKPSDVPAIRFNALLQDPLTTVLGLRSQMRVKAGADYIEFVDYLLSCQLNQSSEQFKPLNYDLRVFESLKDLYNELSRKEQQYKLCRLVSGYAWPWNTKDNNKKGVYDIEIDGLKFCWNRTDLDWINSATSFEEVGCIHTTQGYDLNFVGVIFGREITYNPSLHRIEVIADNYFDKNGKKGIDNPEDLKAYVINIYKTLLFRGIRGAYIYACDENLRKYLRNAIQPENTTFNLPIVPIDKVRPYVNCVPVYDIQVAAGDFSEPQKASERQWVELPVRYNPSPEYFVCKVVGESMNKKISNGSWCLFRKDLGGSREGKIVLVEHYDIHDPDFGAGYTVKEYHSDKRASEQSWKHASITLKPLSDDPMHKDIVLTSDMAEGLMLRGIFVDVLA
jgi:hypothetical protein